MEHRSHNDGSVTQLIGEMRDGDTDAVSALWGRYFPQLANLARKTLGENPRRVADEEDAVISAFATFWKRVNRGEFSDLAGRDSLWKLMAVITIRKAIKQTRRESTAKRGGAHRVLTETDAAPIPGQPFLDTIRQVAGDVSFEEMDSLGYELMESLPDADLRSIALLKLMGYTNQEVAADLGCSIRRIERKLALNRTIWTDESTLFTRSFETHSGRSLDDSLTDSDPVPGRAGPLGRRGLVWVAWVLLAVITVITVGQLWGLFE